MTQEQVIDYAAIRATQLRMESYGHLVSGRYVYRTKNSPAPFYRIENDGSLTHLGDSDETY